VTTWPVERTATRAAGQTDGVFSDLNFGEVFPFVAKPLAHDFLARHIGPFLCSQFAGLPRGHRLSRELNPIAFVAGRPYMDLCAYVSIPAIASSMHSLESADQAKGSAVVGLAREGRLRPLHIPFLDRVLLYASYMVLGVRTLGWLLNRKTPVRLLTAYRATGEELRRLLQQPIQAQAPHVLLRNIDQSIWPKNNVTNEALRHLSVAFLLHALLDQLLSRRVATPLVHQLGQGIQNDFTTEVSLDLWRIAEEARPLSELFFETPLEQLRDRVTTGAAGHCWWNHFEEFLFMHGHRGEVELDISAPRWREAPRFLLQTIINYLRHPDHASSPPQRLAAAVNARKAAASAIRAQLNLPVRILFNWLYSRYVLWMPFREAGKYIGLLWFEWARTIYRDLGRRLVEQGHLVATDDVFLLHLEELEHWARTGTIVWTQSELEERQRQWQQWNSVRPPSLLIGARGVDVDAQSAVTNMLRGTPASTGQVEGIARIMTDPHDAELLHGEILITRYTDPAWTPLFFTASALITEVGGVLSHGAVVAREIGLPAIVGVANATSIIRTGQRLRVNATEGTVELL
jgi:phosphohistidine swiveling domain-containing protein